jgi:NAD(P)H-hydrate epimerase
MVLTDVHSPYITNVTDDLTRYDTIGIGPGMGTQSETKMMLREIFDTYRHPVVLDADALNIISKQKDLLPLIPAGSILTPHPKEFERLFGESSNDFERINLALENAKKWKLVIVLKGHHTLIATADGKGFINSTGNPGMATGGTGDVLTGLLTGLLAQGYSTVEAAVLGVYLHGLAGDLAAEQQSMEAMKAGDLVDQLGRAFLLVEKWAAERHIKS